VELLKIKEYKRVAETDQNKGKIEKWDNKKMYRI
jgi:hypothetical protein